MFMLKHYMIMQFKPPHITKPSVAEHDISKVVIGFELTFSNCKLSKIDALCFYIVFFCASYL